MASRAIAPVAAPRTYAELRRGVEEVVFAGRARIEAAWLRTYHDTGRLIHEHLLLNRDRADHGAKVFVRLSADTGISRRVLYECVQLYRYFPIVRTSAQLTRSHYRLLCQVADRTQRESLLAQTTRHDWPVAELSARVRAANAIAHRDSVNGSDHSPQTSAPEILTPKRGTPGLHLIIDRGSDGLAVDLGFKLYRSLSPEQSRRLAKGDIVRLAADGSIHRAGDATKAELFTYTATIRRIIDGDTLVIALQIAPDIWLEEKLRLRGLDCPELSTPEGKAAKRFVEALVPGSREVILSTTKPDKYDRYLADVFIPAAGAELFLNNSLLEHDHADRKDAWEFSDWE